MESDLVYGWYWYSLKNEINGSSCDSSKLKVEQQNANESKQDKWSWSLFIIVDHESIIPFRIIIIIWSILPVVIRSSQRLSHACVSLNSFSVKLRMAHYISYSLFGIVCIWITVVILGLIHVFSLLGNQ